MRAIFFTSRKEKGRFIHAFLDALDMAKADHEARVVIEGESADLLPDFFKEGTSLSILYNKAEDLGLVAGVCRVCSQTAGSLEFAKERGFPILEEIAGHSSMRR